MRLLSGVSTKLHTKLSCVVVVPEKMNHVVSKRRTRRARPGGFDRREDVYVVAGSTRGTRAWVVKVVERVESERMDSLLYSYTADRCLE